MRVQVAKNRRLEILKFGSRTTYRASTQDVLRVRLAYPKLAENIDSFTDSLKNHKFKAPAKEIYEVAELASLRDPEFAKLFGFEAEKIDPKAKDAVIRVYNRLHDPVAFQMHTKALAEDAAVEMMSTKSGKSLLSLEQGELTETAVLRVLVKRQKAKGEKNFSTVKDFVTGGSDNPNEFREAIVRGPFFDKAFKDDAHAMASHLLQRDFVDDVIWDATGGNPQIFWNFAADSKTKNRVWNGLFDHDRKQGLNNPEEYVRRVNGLLKLRTESVGK